MTRTTVSCLLLLALVGCATEPEHPAGPYGRITVATVTPPVDLYRVVLQRVDGKVVTGAGSFKVPANVSMMVVRNSFYLDDARSDFDLPPGEHVISLTAVVDRPDAKVFAPPPPSHLADNNAGVLRLNVEAGKRYYLAAKVVPTQPEQWQAVVYQTEDIRGYQQAAR